MPDPRTRSIYTSERFTPSLAIKIYFYIKFLTDLINTDKNFISAFCTLQVTQNELDSINVMPLITYLAGYCVYRFLKTVKCEYCRENLTLDKTLELDEEYRFILNMDRGGLLCPQPDVITVVSYTYIVVKKLVSEEHEDNFLKVCNQRSLAWALTYQILIDSECITYDQCNNGHTLENILNFVIKASCNTFLKNYCNQKNDVLRSTLRKRKLQTLVK
ncbi:uncharacterized protein LOC118195870 [Stegodyphus dumicola]|uniref:uncharacterized protein LOC118195870 n=1 Tax=Stegodyphus dumicola TaxID=202533 RepID=UPI0015AD5C4F|nr:uncharacterized protein LOC118195870 [Stegodyphus dumicola]